MTGSQTNGDDNKDMQKKTDPTVDHTLVRLLTNLSSGMVSLIANYEEQCHAVPHNDEEPQLLVAKTPLCDLRKCSIERYGGSEEYHHAVYAIHIGVCPACINETIIIINTYIHTTHALSPKG
jgi:hypothetical protein